MAIEDIIFNIKVQNDELTLRLQSLAKLQGVAQGEIDQLQKNAKKTASQIGQIEKAFNAQKIVSDTNKVSKSVNNLGIQFTDAAKQAAAFVGVQNILNVIGNIPKAIYDATVQMEQLQYTFERLLGSSGYAKKFIEDLNQFASQNALELIPVQNQARALVAMGLESTKVVETLQMIGNVQTAIGYPIEELSRSYGKVIAQGVAQAEELNLFADNGVPIMIELSKMLGKSVRDIKLMASQNKITADHIQEAFKRLGGEGGRFDKLMEERAKGMAGTMSKLRYDITKAFVDVGEILKPVIIFILEQFRGLIERFREVAEVGQNIATVIGNLGGFFKENKEIMIVFTAALVTANAELIALGFNQLKAALNAQFFASAQGRATVASRAFAMVIGLQKNAIIAMDIAQKALNRTMMLNPYALAVAGLVGIGFALKGAYNGNKEFREQVDRLGGKFKPLMVHLQNFWKYLQRLIVKGQEFIGKQNLMTFVIRSIQLYFSFLGKYITGIIDGIGWLIDKFDELIKWATGNQFEDAFKWLAQVPGWIYGFMYAFQNMIETIFGRLKYFAEGAGDILAGVFTLDTKRISKGINALEKEFKNVKKEMETGFQYGVTEFYMEEKGADDSPPKPEEKPKFDGKEIPPIKIKLEADTEQVLKEIRELGEKAYEQLAKEALKEHEFQLRFNYDVEQLSELEQIEALAKINEEVKKAQLAADQELERERQKQKKIENFRKLDLDREAEEERIKGLIKEGKGQNEALLRLQEKYLNEYVELEEVYIKLEHEQQMQANREIMFLDEELARNRLETNRKYIQTLFKQNADTYKELVQAIKATSDALFNNDETQVDRRLEQSEKIYELELQQLREQHEERMSVLGKNQQAQENATEEFNLQVLKLNHERYKRDRDVQIAAQEQERELFRKMQEERIQELEAVLQRGIDLAEKYAGGGPLQAILGIFQKTSQQAIKDIETLRQAFGRNTILDALIQEQELMQEQADAIKKEIDEMNKAYADGNDALKEALEARKKLLEEHNKQIAQNQQKQTEEQRKNEIARRKAIIDVVQSTSLIITQTLNQALQQNIDRLNEQASAQENNVNRVRQALQQGGEAAKNFSAEQLEAEETRLTKINELRERDLRRQEVLNKAELIIQSAAAIAQIQLATAVAVAKGAASTQPFSYIGIAQVLAALAIGLSRGRTQASQAVQQFAKGGPIDGPRHSRGGTMIEAEGGEFIINRNQASKYGKLIEAINDDDATKINSMLHGLKETSIYPLIANQYKDVRPNAIQLNNIDNKIDKALGRLSQSFESRFTQMQAAFERKQFDVFIEQEKIHGAWLKAQRAHEKRGTR